VSTFSYPIKGELIIKQDEDGLVTKRFEFDQVFQPASTQAEVFEDVHATSCLVARPHLPCVLIVIVNPRSNLL